MYLLAESNPPAIYESWTSQPGSTSSIYRLAFSAQHLGILIDNRSAVFDIASNWLSVWTVPTPINSLVAVLPNDHHRAITPIACDCNAAHFRMWKLFLGPESFRIAIKIFRCFVRYTNCASLVGVFASFSLLLSTDGDLVRFFEWGDGLQWYGLYSYLGENNLWI